MVATGAMAGLATDADFREVGGVLSGVSIIAAFDGGTVAVSTSGVPVLQMAGPEERGIRGYGLIGLQVKPALATGFASAVIPGHIKGLQMAFACVQQILLQWRRAESVNNVECLSASFTLRFNQEGSVSSLAKARVYPVKRYLCIIEVSFDRGPGGGCHGGSMMRLLPLCERFDVAAAAGLTTDIG